jgi:NitT/TauT family transport system substrate-binding protein
MRSWWRWGIVAILLVTGAVALAVLTGRLSESKVGVEQLEYRLKWLANAGFVGDLYADSYGYYLNAGLRVKVSPGGPNRDALTALLTPNSATLFAVASADQVLQAVYRGSTDLRVIAQIYAGNPVQWIYRSSLGTIDSPDKLKGKKIGVTIGDNDETIMKAYLKKNRISQSDVDLVGVQFDLTPFTSGRLDLFPVYTNTQGVELQRQMAKENTKVAFFDPSTIGVRIQFVANSIVTTSRMIVEHKSTVQSFLDATLHGWADGIAAGNLDRAARAVMLAAGDTASDVETIKSQIQQTGPLVKLNPQYHIGTIDIGAWKETETTMYEARLLKDGSGSERPIIGIEAYLDAEFLTVR